MEPHFTYRVSDTLPAMDITLMRNGVAVDLTGVLSTSVHFRQSGGSTNVIVGSASVSQATAGRVIFHISAAATGASGFPSPGYYLGQFFGSWASGRFTSEDIIVEVKRSYRVLG